MSKSTSTEFEFNTLSHKGEVAMKSLMPGHTILGLSSGKEVLNFILRIEHKETQDEFYKINETILLHKDQLIFVNGVIMKVKQLLLGDEILGLWYKRIPVKSIEKVEGKYTNYLLKVSGNKSYFINNILVHDNSAII